MKTITTPQGELQLVPAPAKLLSTINSFLPFGVYGFKTPQNGANYGIAMQCGDQEVFCIKQQPVDCDEEHGSLLYKAHSWLIAHSIGGYLRNGFSGLLMPCAYIRQKEAGKVEPGIAYFGVPSPHGRESQEFPFDELFDPQFGHGFKTMMMSFIRELQQSSIEKRIPLFQTIGLDMRPRLHLGSLGFGFMVVGPHVVCLQPRVTDGSPIWESLRCAGIAEVFHMPSIPLEIASDLRKAERPTSE
ncbi:MAG TPA: hypothetical protein VM735_06755 [Candidatus Kapabacteria bacterium]|jgi:hypothetical protein|nr:hypothetical protein [Candidatus Kapabacteria bacterium]